MMKVIRDMLLEGYTAADIAEIAAHEEGKLEEENKAAAAVEDAKVKMIEATANYMMAAGLLSKEDIDKIDWNYIEEGFSLIEKMFLPKNYSERTEAHESPKLTFYTNCSSAQKDVFEKLWDTIQKMEKEGI